MTIYEVFLDFISEKSVSCSDKTVHYYCENLMRFFSYIGDYVSKSINLLTKQTVNDYIFHLRESGIKNVSINTYLRAVRVFVNWCYQKGYYDNNFSHDLKFLKSDKKNIVPLYQEEVVSIDNCFDMSTVLGLRNYIMFHLMLDCGLRRNEVLRYSWNDFLPEKNVLSVLGKGNKYRLVPVPELLKDKLLIYHNIGFNGFMNKTGEVITENTIKQMFSKLKGVSGINRLHPHLLRHTFATSYMIGGGNLEFLRLILGHTDYEVTKNYLHLANQFRLLGANIYRLDSIFFQKGY